MKIQDSHNVYQFVLGELEWYGVNEAARQSTIENCMRGATEAKRPYAAIIVQPDEAMSISPNPRRHQVWRHTFSVAVEDALRRDLESILNRDYGIPPARVCQIMREVWPGFSEQVYGVKP